MKDTVVSGSLRATDTLYSTTAQFQILRAPTSSNGTTFGPGSANNLLKSNGTSVYWTTLVASDIPSLSTDKLTSGTLGVARGGTGVSSFTANSVIISGDTTTAALTTRAIYNRTTKGNLEWTTATTDTHIITKNTLAFWDGSYSGTSSNLTYCIKGAFGNAVTYGVDDATANGALGTGTNLTTERSVYYGLVTVNNASQTRATGIYAPTSAGTANQILVSAGGTSAPIWKATANGAAYATSANGALTFGTLPVAQGGTGVTSIANIKAGKDGDGNTISSTYLKLSGGTLTGDLGIIFENTDKFLNFWYNTGKIAGGSWRLGVLGSGSEDTNYFVIQSGTAGTSATTWNNAIRIGQNTYDVAFGGNIYPLTNNAKTLGTSSYKWSNVYATTFTGDLTGNVTGNVSGTSANVTGTIAIEHGGTGATTAAAARTSLEITPANIGAVNKAGDTMTGNLNISGDVYAIFANLTASENPALFYRNSDNTSSFAAIYGITSSQRLLFREFTPNTSYYEDYNLPTPTTTSSNKSYNILTTKSAVAVDQGGTEATSASDAKINLAVHVQLNTASWSNVYTKLSKVTGGQSAFFWITDETVAQFVSGTTAMAWSSGIVTNTGSAYRFYQLTATGNNGNGIIRYWEITNLTSTSGTVGPIKTMVTGIKGDAESTYRTGNVNLTPANIGALPTTGGDMTSGISFIDSNNHPVGGISYVHDTNDTDRTYLIARNLDNSSNIQLGVKRNSDNSLSYHINNPAQFRQDAGITPANIGAPSTSGSGASGTWGISITGNAATASSSPKLTLQAGNVSSTSTNTYATNGLNVRWFTETGKLPGQPTTYGFLLTMAMGDSATENHQIWCEQPNGNLYHRGTNGSTYTSPPAFKTILDSGNYTHWASPAIQEMTFADRTNDKGNVSLRVTTSSHVVVCVKVTSYIATPWASGDGWWYARITTIGINNNAVADTDFTVTVYYQAV